MAADSYGRDEGAGADARTGAGSDLLTGSPPLTDGQPVCGSDAGELTHSPLAVLVAERPLQLPPRASAEEAVAALAEAGRNAAVVDGSSSGSLGLVLAGDLRRRLVGGELARHIPIQDVARRLPAVDGDTPVGRALSLLARNRVGRVGVVRGEELLGLVGFEELAQRQAGVSLGALASLPPAERHPVLQRYGEALSATVDTLFRSGLEPMRISSILATLSDTLTVRLLQQAERDLGEPPCPYSWLALGSQGRSEPALLSDQDSALVYRDEDPATAAWFTAFAEQVVGGLEAAGYPRCSGGFMATAWCRSLAEWQRVVRTWVHTPESQAVLETNLFLDFRTISGWLAVDSLDDLLLTGADSEVFLAQIARSAMGFRPPLSLFGRLKAPDGRIDLKLGGITAIVLLARLHGLAARSRSRPTLERLAAASGATLSPESSAALSGGLHFLNGLRLREQVRRRGLGDAPDNTVPLERLSQAERRRLRDELRTVSVVQQATALKFHVHD